MLSTSDFYVLTMISNPVRYRRRYELYNKFKDMCSAGKVKLITVEVALGNRDFNVTERDNPMHVQLRTIDELWHKENALNVGLNYLMQMDPSAKKVAWVDADVSPAMPPEQWFYETAQALEHYEVVQMFEHAQDLDYGFSPTGKLHHGFLSAWVKSGYQPPSDQGFWKIDGYTRFGHPGYAWAANIEALSKLGGFFDVGILGSNDRNMACALLQCFEQSIPQDCTPQYRQKLKLWQERCERYIKLDVGYVPGLIYHYWHGNKKNRGYVDRWKILIRNEFDPDQDLKRDAQGLYQLESWSPRQQLLRDQIRTYFRQRSEDSIE